MNKIKVADYIAQRCVDKGVEHTFLVTGGGAMFLNDAFHRNKNLNSVCFHHEQAAAIAAESYFRVTRKLAVLNVTTGPGGINALNGVYGAYVDSLGMIVVSGQVKKETYAKTYSTPFRQLGDQEVDIISMAKPVVKYATTLFDPLSVGEVMDKALFLSTYGRPGPVWIDVPIDVQSSLIDPTQLKRFDTNNLLELAKDNSVTENTKIELLSNFSNIDEDIDLIIEKLNSSKYPVIFAGAGVRISGAHKDFLNLIDILKIPVVTGWNAHDNISNDCPYYAGRPGTVGDRAGNFSLQNSDFVLVLGSRLNIRQISYNFKNFANKAWKAVVDIDPTELDKPTLNLNLKVRADLKEFISKMIVKTKGYVPKHQFYLNWCKQKVKEYPVVAEIKNTSTYLNPYLFFDYLFKNNLKDSDVIVTGNGSACVISFQTATIKEGQRLFTNSGSASMGYDIPAAIGASLSLDKKRVICIAGDGSIMMNLQELSTIVGYQLPIKIILINNNGYLSIKQTQLNYFADNVFGIDSSNGVNFPDFVKLAESMGLQSIKINSILDWEQEKVQFMFNDNNPALFEIIVDPNQSFTPKLAAKKLPDGSLLSPSLENMSPFLSDEEMKRNIL